MTRVRAVVLCVKEYLFVLRLFLFVSRFLVSEKANVPSTIYFSKVSPLPANSFFTFMLLPSLLLQ